MTDITKRSEATFWATPTFKYRHLVKKLTQQLFEKPYFSSTTVGVLLRSGEKAWLSSSPKTTMKIIAKGLYRGDLLLSYGFSSANKVMFPREFAECDDIQRNITTICEMTGQYRGYCIARDCDDCCVIATYNTRYRVSNPELIYKDSIDVFETFIVEFINLTLPIYLKSLPSLSDSRFSVDHNFRERVIRDRKTTSNGNLNLLPAEIKILYWASRGKTSDEISRIVELTKNTIDTYKRNIIKKLDVANVTEAVRKSLHFGIIV